MLKRVLLLCLAGITLLLIWFTFSNYRKSRFIADEVLFGTAHSLHAAIEFSVHQNPSLQALSSFHSHDLASFALIDNKGIYRFSSVEGLVGTQLRDNRLLQKMTAETMVGQRVRLSTGEEGYELFTHVHVPDGTLGLILVIHTNRADAVIKSARINIAVVVTLLLLSWLLAVLIYRYARREDQHRLELSRQENLAKMGEMGAILAHEIRNPLAGIKGFAQLIERKTNDPSSVDSAQRIIVETLRLEELTSDLLAFARSDDFALTNILLSELIEYTVAMVHTEAEQVWTTIAIDCLPGLEIRGNRDRLTQVILNIVRNGLQAMPDGGKMFITARPAGSCNSVTVTDSGHGINQDDMQKIFEPFFTTKARGTGLGLALCKKIIEEHNGTISIESSSVGTTVTLVLPTEWPRGDV